MENAFVVTPMSQNFDLEPGKTYTGSITVANSGSATQKRLITAKEAEQMRTRGERPGPGAVLTPLAREILEEKV